MSEFETGTDDLLARQEGHVGVITFNRPDRRNALSNEMYHGFRQVLPKFATDPGIRVVMITGAGGAFCAGGDVKAMDQANRSNAEGPKSSTPIDHAIHRQRRSQRGTAGRLYAMSKPTIAALPGAAAGAGLSLALACDLRIASDSAILTTAFAKV